MENKESNINALYRNVFKKINILKEYQIINKNKEVRNRLNKLSNRFNNFLDYIDYSIVNDMLTKGGHSKNKFLTMINSRKNLYNKKSDSDNSIKPNSLTKRNKTNFSLEISKNKILNKNKINKNILLFGNRNNKEINYHQKSCLTLRKGPERLKSSIVLNDLKKDLKYIKKRNISASNSAIYSTINNNLNNNDNKNARKIIINKETLANTINEYNYKGNKKNNMNISKNLSFSLNNKTNRNYFWNYKETLRPDILTKFVKNSKEIEKSFKNDLDINMKKKTKKLLKLAKKEINLKDPNYHQKRVFKNVLQVKKTIRAVKRIRNEKIIKVKYHGPGNINNETFIRKKNANLMKFFDVIAHMKDDKFYIYNKVINDYYPNLVQKAIKEKYQSSEKKQVKSFYQTKSNENSFKIEQLLASIK